MKYYMAMNLIYDWKLERCIERVKGGLTGWSPLPWLWLGLLADESHRHDGPVAQRTQHLSRGLHFLEAAKAIRTEVLG